MRTNLPVTDRERTFTAEERLISTTDLRGKITYCNDAFVAISGFSREELIGQPHNLVRHPDMPSAVFGQMWDRLKRGESWMGVVKNRCQNGDYYWVSAYVTPIWENGAMLGFESVRSLPTAEQKQRATRLYARLRRGQPALSLWQRALEILDGSWPMALAALLLFGAQLLPQPWPQAGIVAVLLALAVWQACERRRRIEVILRSHPKAFSCPLVALTYSDRLGAEARLDLAL